MKRIIIFSVIIMAMFFLNSCAKCDSCATPPRQTQQQQWVAREVIIKGGASFTDAYLCECPTSMRFEVRDANCNNPEFLMCTDSLVFKRAHYDYGGWNYACNGPARVGGKGDAVVMQYPDGSLAQVAGYPKAINLKVTEFYGY